MGGVRPAALRLRRSLSIVGCRGSIEGAGFSGDSIAEPLHWSPVADKKPVRHDTHVPADASPKTSGQQSNHGMKRREMGAAATTPTKDK